MREFQIKVNIANRTYPMIIDREEEESMLQAAKMVTNMTVEYERIYAVKDSQDLLAMCALHYAKQSLDYENGKIGNENEIRQIIDEITGDIHAYMKEKPAC